MRLTPQINDIEVKWQLSFFYFIYSWVSVGILISSYKIIEENPKLLGIIRFSTTLWAVFGFAGFGFGVVGWINGDVDSEEKWNVMSRSQKDYFDNLGSGTDGLETLITERNLNTMLITIGLFILAVLFAVLGGTMFCLYNVLSKDEE